MFKHSNITYGGLILICMLKCSGLSAAEGFDFADPLTPSSQHALNGDLLEQRLQEKFKLQGVFSSEQVAYVIINGITLMTGDQIAGYTITSISAEEIRLHTREGREVAIRPYRFSLDKPRIQFTDSYDSEASDQ